jgi:hypothetical protein
VTAFRTRRGFCAGFLGVQMIASNTVKRDLTALGIIEAAIAAIIVDPKETEDGKDEQTVKNNIQRIDGRIYHGRKFTRTNPNAKGK